MPGRVDHTLDPFLALVGQPGLPSGWKASAESAFADLFSTNGRYKEVGLKTTKLRAPEIAADNVPFAAFIHVSNSDKGPYSGMSIAIFPVENGRPLLTFVVGTGGLDPDEMILGRPGHARKIQAICAWLNANHGGGKLIAWAKQDPTRIDQPIPSNVQAAFSSYNDVFAKYGNVIYGMFAPSDSPAATRDALFAFFDLLFDERFTATRAAAEEMHKGIHQQWSNHITTDLTPDEVLSLLRTRRYVVIEGPPGTGKTRLAKNLVRETYANNGKSVQFHPNTTYENFVGGLAPTHEATGVGLNFIPKPGYLMEAAAAAAADPERHYLLHIDEINRADLSKILGEAIYLFEPAEQREIDLPYDFGMPHGTKLSLPKNLHVLGTMNTADRSLAIVDVAVRRRFAFAKLWPQRQVVDAQGDKTMSDAFDSLMDIFVEYASDDALNLVPGHSYFLLTSGLEPAQQLQVTLKPLLEEYLAQGYVGGFAEPIRSYLQWLDSL